MASSPGDELNRSAGLLKGTVDQLQSVVSRISSDISGLVKLYDPAAFKRFALVANDLTASIGRALVPVLERFRVVVRAVADGIASLSPQGRALVAGLAAATIGMAAMAAATVAFSVTVNSALGGIPAILGALAGAATGLTFALKDTAGIQQAITAIARAANGVFNQLGAALGQVFTAVSPLIDTMAAVAGKMGGTLAGAIAQLAPVFARVVPMFADLAATLAEVGAANIQTFAGLFVSLADTLTTIAPALVQVIGLTAQLGGLFELLKATGIQAVLALIGPPLQGLATLLELVLTPMTMAAQLFGGLVGVITSVVVPVMRGLSDAFATPFRLIGDLFRTVMAPLKGALTDLFSAFQNLRQVFGEVFVLVGEVAGEVFKMFAGLLPVIVGPLDLMAKAVSTLARWVNEFAAEVRALFGITSPDTFQKDASEGIAVRNTSTGSVDSLLAKARESAFSVGKDPPVQTATNTKRAVVLLEELMRKLDEWVGRLPDEIGAAVSKAVAGAVGRVAGNVGGPGADWVARGIANQLIN